MFSVWGVCDKSNMKLPNFCRFAHKLVIKGPNHVKESKLTSFWVGFSAAFVRSCQESLRGCLLGRCHARHQMDNANVGLLTSSFLQEDVYNFPCLEFGMSTASTATRFYTNFAPNQPTIHHRHRSMGYLVWRSYACNSSADAPGPE